MSSRTAVSANELALEGVRAENSVGNRNVLDVLNAEQELLNSQVQLVTAQRDAYVAAFALLAAMGRAEARELGLFGGALFAPVLKDRESAPVSSIGRRGLSRLQIGPVLNDQSSPEFREEPSTLLPMPETPGAGVPYAAENP